MSDIDFKAIRDRLLANVDNMVVVAKPPQMVNTAVQQASKHFDIVLAIDMHLTQLSPITPPIPLPHPFIGIIFDPMEYVNISIPVPSFLHDKLGESMQLGAKTTINGKIRANTTTSVMGINIPTQHVTGALPTYRIIFGSMEGAHDGEIYYGSSSVIVEGCEMSGSFPAQVLTCWCMPMGIQYFPPAMLAMYHHITSAYIQIPFGKPVMIGGQFVPHKYTLSDILMRLGAVIGMKLIGIVAKKGLTLFNKALKKVFGPTNPVSRLLCACGFEPVNFVTGAMNFEWDDFTLGGAHDFVFTNIWESDNPIKGFLGNGVANKYELFIVSEEGVGTVWRHPEEHQNIPIPYIEVGADWQFYRPWKVYQRRPNSVTWEIRHKGHLYTYRSMQHDEYDTIYRISHIQYADGSTLDFSYYDGMLMEIVDGAGRKLMFTFNTENRCIVEINFEYKGLKEFLVRYRYDPRGNLTHVFDCNNKCIEFQYNAQNLVIKRINRNGMEYVWTYDDAGRVVHTTGLGGFQEGRIVYHPDQGYNEVFYVQAGNKKEVYHYDEKNLIYKKIDAMGGETWYDYNANNELKMEASPEGRVVGYQYDTMGRLIKHKAPDGQTLTMEYDAQDRVILRSDGTLSEVWEYDPLGRTATFTGGDGKCTHYFYHDHAMQPYKTVDGDGVETLWHYNDFGQVKHIERDDDWEGFSYDHRGQLCNVNGNHQQPVSLDRDQLGRITQYRHHTDKWRITYDAYDLPVMMSDGRTDYFMEYTPMGSVKKEIRRERLGMQYTRIITYDYNAYEELKRITNEAGEQYRFIRNANGLICEEIEFDGSRKTYQRNRDGLVMESVLPSGRVFHEYDLAGRLVYNRFEDGSWESFDYNNQGLLIKTTNQHTTTTFEHNAIGQVIKECQDRHSLEYTYDTRHRLTEICTSLGGKIAYDYDKKGFMSGIEAGVSALVPSPFGTLRSEKWRGTFQTNVHKQQIDSVLGGNVEQCIKFDKQGHVFSHKVEANQKSTLVKMYTWNFSSQLSSVLNGLTGGRVQYHYDAFGSLHSSESRSNVPEEKASTLYKNPNAGGNLFRTNTQSDKQYNAGGQIIRDRDWRYLYDKNGNLRFKKPAHTSMEDEAIREDIKQKSTSFWKKIDIFDEQFWENPQIEKDYQKEFAPEWKPGDWEYQWYANGMLESVRGADGRLTKFEYDALGRRTSKITGGVIYRYLWEGNRMIHEWNYPVSEAPHIVVEESGKCVYNAPEPLDNLITWVYERGSFAPTAKLTSKGNYSIISDYIGRAIQAYDASGKLFWSTDYDIYGDLTDLKGERHFVPFRQAGQYEDSETGLYYNRFRYYDPALGTYLSKDPIGLEGGNPNLYGYVFDSNSEVDVLGLAGNDILHGSNFWKKISSAVKKTKRQVKGATIYEIVKKVNIEGLKKGDFFHLDTLHKNEIEVYDSDGKHKGVYDLDGNKIGKPIKGRFCN